MGEDDGLMRSKVLGGKGPDLSVVGFGAWEISIDESPMRAASMNQGLSGDDRSRCLDAEPS